MKKMITLITTFLWTAITFAQQSKFKETYDFNVNAEWVFPFFQSGVWNVACHESATMKSQ